MIRVLLVDDDTLVRQGIRHLLSLAPDVEVVGEAGDGEEALARVRELAPDVVLLDARMPRLSGLDVLAALAAPAPPCLLLTTFDDSDLFLEAIRRGARGYLRKDVAFEELLAALRTLAGGGPSCNRPSPSGCWRGPSRPSLPLRLAGPPTGRARSP